MITERFIRSDRKTILGADDKAALSIFMEGIKYIKKFNIPHPDIYFVFTYAEEQGLVGAKNLDFSLIKAKSGFSFDAGGRVGQVIVSAPTHYQYKILCYGQAAHAGIEPEKGKSAIKIAADVIQKIETGKLDHETTANVGTINGGVATNIVPERVKIEGEVRSRNKSTLLNYLKRLKITLEKIKKKYDGNIDLHLSQAYQSYHFHSDSFLVKKFMEAVKKIKRKPVLVEINGGHDANILKQNGFQCLNCGIGMTHVHSTKEFIPITELIHGLKLFLSLVISW